MIEEKKMNTIVTNMRNSTKPKPLPVKANKQTWYFDTPQGVDHVTKVLHDNTDMKPEDVIKLNRESKEQLIKQEEKGLLKEFEDAVKKKPDLTFKEFMSSRRSKLKDGGGVTGDTLAEEYGDLIDAWVRRIDLDSPDQSLTDYINKIRAREKNKD